MKIKPLGKNCISNLKYDLAIIGSGIGGSTLASILARQGLSVIVFEGGQHPRFTIGESMILETSKVMRALAEFYDVPEPAYYSSEKLPEHRHPERGQASLGICLPRGGKTRRA